MAPQEAVQGLRYSEIYILTFSKNVLLIYFNNSSAPKRTLRPHCARWQSRITLLSPQLSTLLLPSASPSKPVIKDILEGKKKPTKKIRPFTICQRFSKPALFYCTVSLRTASTRIQTNSRPQAHPWFERRSLRTSHPSKWNTNTELFRN